MARHERIIEISESLDRRVWAYLHAQRAESRQDEDDVICVTAVFDDGRQVDVKCCGSQTEPSWTEAVLFDADGTQLDFTDTGDEFTGEWGLAHGDDLYVAVVRVKTETAAPDETHPRVATLYAGDRWLVTCEYVDSHVDGTNVVDMISEAATEHFVNDPEGFANVGHVVNLTTAALVLNKTDTTRYGFRILEVTTCDAVVDPNVNLVDPLDVPESQNNVTPGPNAAPEN